MSRFMKEFMKRFAKVKKPEDVPGQFDPEKDKVPEGATVLGEMSNDLKRDFAVLMSYRHELDAKRNAWNAEIDQIIASPLTPAGAMRAVEIKAEFKAILQRHELRYQVFWHDLREEFKVSEDTSLKVGIGYVAYVPPVDFPEIHIIGGSGAADLLAAIFASAGR